MGYDAFIIHANPDRAQALELRQELAALGLSVFVDVRDAPAGRWPASLSEALNESLVWVVLLGPPDQDHDGYYRDEEVTRAIQTMRRHHARDRIRPVLLEARDELPYGLQQQQTLHWQGARGTAQALLHQIHSLRGMSPGAQRVSVAIVGRLAEVAEEMSQLQLRLAQHTAIIDGNPVLVDVGRAPIPDVTLRVVLLGGTHGGCLESLRELVDDALSSDSRERHTLVAALRIDLGEMDPADRVQALEVQILHDRMRAADRKVGRAYEVIDALDTAVLQWHATRFPSRPGLSAGLEPWEQRYLADRVDLWRTGDPSVLRMPGDRRVDRDRWYVHLKADAPWIEWESDVRYEKPIRRDSESEGPSREWAQSVPVELQWTRGEDGSPRHLLSRQMHQDLPRPWLDQVVSHPALPRAVLVGSAGAGKTVFLQHIAWALASRASRGPEEEPVHRFDHSGVRGHSPCPPIPVLHPASTLVEHLRGGRSVREALVALLRHSFADRPDLATLQAGFDVGRYVFLIDSLDEVPREKDRITLVDALGRLPDGAPRVILTTRPSEHTAVELPVGFVRIDVAPLDGEAQDRLARRWAHAWNLREVLDDVLAAVAAVRDDFPSFAGERSPVESPLLLTCILQIYKQYRRLPADIATLYDDMVRILCAAKVVAGDHSSEQRKAAQSRDTLRQLFFATQERGGVQLPLADAHALLLAEHAPYRDTVDAELRRLANQTGLLRFVEIDRQTFIRPWHRSFQEFLAAETIVYKRANDADACVAWLRDPHGDGRSRLLDPSWLGTLRFLVGTATLHRREWGVRLIEALANAATRPGPEQAALYTLALEGVAEYADDLTKEPIRAALPSAATAAHHTHGASWNPVGRIGVLDALGRIGDPRLDDPLTTSDLTYGWVKVTAGEYPVSPERIPLRTTRVQGAETHRDAKRRYRTPQSDLPRMERARFVSVRIKPFWIRRWPVTVAEFKQFIDDIDKGNWPYASPSYSEAGYMPPDTWRAQKRYPSRPVVNVTYDGARDFCRWATARWLLPCTGVIDLPTSIEWEVAGRRGTRRSYPWGDEAPTANHCPAFTRLCLAPTPVGAFPDGHTPEGLWDMAGNVAQWCSTRADSVAPLEERVCCGGSWMSALAELLLGARTSQCTRCMNPGLSGRRAVGQGGGDGEHRHGAERRSLAQACGAVA